MRRAYRFIDTDAILGELTSAMERLERDHYLLTLQLETMRPAVGEGEESFNQRRQAVLEQLTILENSLQEYEARIPAPVLEEMEARVQRRRPLAPVGGLDGTG
jgi:hypothetical protein